MDTMYSPVDSVHSISRLPCPGNELSAKSACAELAPLVSDAIVKLAWINQPDASDLLPVRCRLDYDIGWQHLAQVLRVFDAKAGKNTYTRNEGLAAIHRVLIGQPLRSPHLVTAFNAD